MEKVTVLAKLEQIRDALSAAGMPRISPWAGGEMTGWTNAMGSTGWSCFSFMNDAQAKQYGGPSDTKLMWHVIVSGKPHMRYHTTCEVDSCGDSKNMHEPENPDVLFPRIRTVFEELGFQVRGVRVSSWQRHWDDDVEYNVYTDHPADLERKR